MPVVTPYVPQEITVHLGAPSEYAQNVTVSFPDYVKNVAASEIYPTWEDSAIRANILAIVSFALNRVYTEYYPSRGYSFNITGSTAIDQKFIYGRNTFDNIDRIADELFNDYIRRQNTQEPLAAKFCNGTTTTCQGLSQWGSQDLAQQGYDSVEILKTYYGNDIELVIDAPIDGIRSSYPGTPLRAGDFGADVVTVQVALNRVSQSYPAIPKIVPVDGVFGRSTEDAVIEFQTIFNLSADGIVGQATFNKLILLYVGLLKLSELSSEGQQLFSGSIQYPDLIGQGSTGESVSTLQFYLSVLAEFIPQIPAVEITGEFNQQTRNAVTAFQQYEGIQQTGVVGTLTWDLIYREYIGIQQTVTSDETLFPYASVSEEEMLPASSRERVSLLQSKLSSLGDTYPSLGAVAVSGLTDGATIKAVKNLQAMAGIPVTGKMNESSWHSLRQLEIDRSYSKTVRLGQYPGHPLEPGMQDRALG